MQQTELICPNCREGLARNGQVMSCENGHSFDVAREGYVNLLTGKRKASTITGDSAEMVRARRAFLERGYYVGLAAEVARAVRGEAAAGPRVVADVGCGEGYYLGELMADPALAGAAFYGTDIAKPAIAAAAKAHPGAQFVVADTNALIPLADASVDVLVDIFAPRNAEEFARVVRPGGRAVIVVPGPAHLEDLRERFRLMAIESDKAAKITAQLTDFEPAGTRTVAGEIHLDGPALHDLLEMTPNARFMDNETRRETSEIAEITTGIEFEVLVFTRRG